MTYRTEIQTAWVSIKIVFNVPSTKIPNLTGRGRGHFGVTWHEAAEHIRDNRYGETLK